MTALRLLALAEKWPIAGSFTISRGAKQFADVVVAEISDGVVSGRGECVPYGRYGETVEGVLDQILALEGALAGGLGRSELQNLLPAGAARNALDCALFDLQAKQTGRAVWDLAGLPAPTAQDTAFTISLGSPEEMARDARNARDYKLLKLKLGGSGPDSAENNGLEDAVRMQAVRAARPDVRLVADANEGWSPGDCSPLLDAAQAAGFELIEQPLPQGEDALLAEIDRPIPVCADESVHQTSDLADLKDRYDAVNIKLDKTGGLTEAMNAVKTAGDLGFGIMLGCMVCTSLSIAPAFLLSSQADWVDLDGPLLLSEDRSGGLDVNSGKIAPIARELWG